MCPSAATALPCEQSEGGGDAGLHEMLGGVLRRVALVQDACELSRAHAASAAHSMQMLSLLQMQSGLCERASIGASSIAATRREAGAQCKAVQHERSTQCEGRPLTTPMTVELTPPPVAPRVADTLVVDSLHEEATIRCRLPSSTWTSPDLNAGAEMRTLQEVEEKMCAGSSGEGEARGRVETLAEVLARVENECMQRTAAAATATLARRDAEHAQMVRRLAAGAEREAAALVRSVEADAELARRAAVSEERIEALRAHNKGARARHAREVAEADARAASAQQEIRDAARTDGERRAPGCSGCTSRGGT